MRYVEQRGHEDGGRRTESRSGSVPSDDRPFPSNYLSRCTNYSPLSRARERHLAQKIRAGCEASCAELVRSNLDFVVRIASKYRNFGLPFEDLVNEGNLGLVEAARRYDPDVGTKFITYAVWWVRKRILLALDQQVRTVHVPASQIKKVREIREAERSLTMDLGTKPSREAIASRIGKRLSSVDRVLWLWERESSLERGVDEDAERPLSNLLADRQSLDAESRLIDRESVELVTKALLQLSDDERQVVLHRFGILAGHGLTLKQTGDIMHKSRARVWQIEARAKKRLWRILNSQQRAASRQTRPERTATARRKRQADTRVRL